MTEHVEATVIEEGLAPISGLDAMVASISERAAELATEYKPHEIADEQDYKDSKKARSTARKAIEALRADYSERMRVIRDAVKDADARIKAALEPLNTVDASYKEAIDSYEHEWLGQRISELVECYETYAPALVPLVPFERIYERYGKEKGSNWLQRSVNVVRAEQLLYDAIDRIADGEKLVEAGVDAEDVEAAKADYFSSLDHHDAIAKAQARAAQRAEVRRLEEERRASEEEAARIAAEEAERKRLEEQAAQPAPQPEPARPIDTRAVMSREEYEAELAQVMGMQPTPTLRPVTEHQATVRHISGGQTYVVALYSATPEQMQLLAQTLKARGIHGQPKGTGVLLSEEQCADLLGYAYTRAQGYDAPKARRM